MLKNLKISGLQAFKLSSLKAAKPIPRIGLAQVASEYPRQTAVL
ncbi:MAG: hypothetical protein PVF37_10775 [Desulfobacterales bacterium]|jgi:hypothetical protein